MKAGTFVVVPPHRPKLHAYCTHHPLITPNLAAHGRTEVSVSSVVGIDHPDLAGPGRAALYFVAFIVTVHVQDCRARLPSGNSSLIREVTAVCYQMVCMQWL